MIMNRVVSLNITITDMKLLYSADIDDTLLNIFNDTWALKCFNGSYIVKGMSISKRGCPTIDKNSLDAHATVSAEIWCEVIVYNVGDVVVGEIIFIDNNGDLVLKNDHAAINVRSSDLLAKVGDKIPVIVGDCCYPLNKERLSIVAIPFIPLYENQIYTVADDNFFDFTLTETDFELSQMDKIKSMLNPKPDRKAIIIDAGDIRPFKVGSSLTRNTRNFGELSFSPCEGPGIEMPSSEIYERVSAGYLSDMWTISQLVNNFTIAEIEESRWYKFYCGFLQ